jgi:hypothetical protein
MDFKVRSAKPPQDSLGELAAGAVASAHKEHPDRVAGHGSFLSETAGLPDGSNGCFKVGELAIEPVEVIALAGDRRSLVGQERQEVAVDLAPLKAQPGHPTGVFRTESKATQADHELDSGKVDL